MRTMTAEATAAHPAPPHLPEDLLKGDTVNNTFRWALLGLLLAVNAASSILLNDTWYGITVNVLTGLTAIALITHYVLRSRHH
ncbi:hypothetical protein ABGB12_23090 [Actinocorallia sp. B10E7]|uniref:hypothetical protein n=1 Tax=Actinocorallia sp. B10E7 TaxID=3153558 RepID=UPI00325C473B